MIEILVLGCRGTSLDVLDALLCCNERSPSPRYRILGLLDDQAELWGQRVLGFPVLGPWSSLHQYPQAQLAGALGSLKNFRRKRSILESLKVPAERFETVIHPDASISPRAQVGRGCVILQQAVVAVSAQLEDQVIVLPQSVISHDCKIGWGSVLAGGVTVCGYVEVGEQCYLGAGSVVRERTQIGAGSLIGMGSLVLQDVAAGSTCWGQPARVRDYSPS